MPNKYKKALMTNLTDSKKIKEGLVFVLAFLLILGIVSLQGRIAPSVWTWAGSLPALAIVFITATARIRDISGNSWISYLRRVSMAVCVLGAAMGILIPLIPGEPMPTWRNVVVAWGWAGTWFTTPNVGPWWAYISGESKLKRNQEV